MRTGLMLAGVLAIAAPAWGDDAEVTAVTVTVVDALPLAPRLGLHVEPFAGGLWLGGAVEADPRWSVHGGVHLGGDVATDWLGLGDALRLGVRGSYGTVDVDADSAVQHDFVIIAGNEPFLLSGTSSFTGTERLAMATLIGDMAYQLPVAGGLVPWVSVGVGVVELFGDRGKTSFAVRAAAGLEWRVGPSVSATLEVSDLAFRAPVLAGHLVHGVGWMLGVRLRF